MIHEAHPITIKSACEETVSKRQMRPLNCGGAKVLAFIRRRNEAG